MSKELVKSQTTELSTSTQFEDFEVDTRNIVIPKILLMQPISDKVTEGIAKYGDFLNSMTGEVVGNIDKGLEVIPLSSKNYHIVSVKEGTDWNFLRIDPIVSMADDNKPFDDIENGEVIKRQKVLEFFVMAPAVSELPFTVQFRGMSFRNGKAFYTMAFAMAKAMRVMPYERTLILNGTKTKNDKGNFAILTFKSGRKSTAEEIEKSKMWYSTIKASNVVVHDETVQAEQTEMAF